MSIFAPEEFDREFVKPKKGRTLIVGSYITEGKQDRRKYHAEAIGVDLRPGPGVDLVLDLEQPQEIGKFAHIECTSVLEHAKRPWRMAANIEAMMEQGSTLYLSVPFVWRVHNFPNDYWRFTIEGVKLLFPSIVWHTLKLINESGKDRLPSIRYSEVLYFAKCIVSGFGVKR